MGILFENRPADVFQEEEEERKIEPFALDEEIEVPAPEREVNGKPKRLALLAFVAMFAAVFLSTIVYFVSRRETERPAPAAKPVQAQLAIPAPAAVDPPKAVPPIEVPRAVSPAASTVTAPLDEPLANRMYLQVGSLEKGVAEILTQGLRTKGLQATVAPGITPLVARIIVGPFQTAGEVGAANKYLTELGFKPFPRRFEEKELRRLLAEAASAGGEAK